MVAIAVEALGTSAFGKITPQLTTEECGDPARSKDERGRDQPRLFWHRKSLALRTYGLKGAFFGDYFQTLQAGATTVGARERRR